ncbi:MAG: serine hydrolase, partial [Actinobacteria bacterium]|nr:serine hydrolase [Actinomycetota bacterium]
LVSTCHDLTRFFRALLRGGVFRHASTLDMMLTLNTGTRAAQLSPTAMVFLEDDPTCAGMFIYRCRLGGEVCWGHDGWWGVSVFTCPRIDATVATAHNQALMPKRFDPREIIGRVIALLTGAST